MLKFRKKNNTYIYKIRKIVLVTLSRKDYKELGVYKIDRGAGCRLSSQERYLEYLGGILVVNFRF